jgi:hypothetical protein
MIKYLKHPVRLLFIAHASSILVFCYFFWHSNSNFLTEPVITDTSTNTFLPTLAKEIKNWSQYISSLAILYIAFLTGLKMVSSISFKELLIFFLITIPVVCFSLLLSVNFLVTVLQGYLLSIVLLLLSFGLLKISGHWNHIDDGLPD